MSALLMSVRREPHELESVRYLLHEWVRWRKRWRPQYLGYPGQVPYLHQIRATVDTTSEPDDYDEKIELFQMRAIEQAIQNELKASQRHALHVVYLNEEGPAVWRSGRMPMKEIRRFAADAEVALVPILKRLNILL